MPTKFRPTTFPLFCALLIFSGVFPQSVSAQESLAAGKALYQSCLTCHGEQGQGNALLKSPALAGQYAWYIRRQLAHFRSGIRGSQSGDSPGQQMAAVSRQLQGEADIDLLAAYIETLPGTPGVRGEQATGNKNGYRYYQGKCGACHGSEGRGNVLFNAPKLSGQHADYLLAQMKHFTEGRRGADKKDKFGRQMAMMAKTVSKEQLRDIVDYLVAL